MGMKELGKHLTEAADKEIAEIEAKRDASLKALEGEMKSAAEKEAKRISGDGEKSADAGKKRIIAKARIRAKDAIEAEKLAIVEAVFEDARKRILASPESQQRAVLEKMAKEACAGVEKPVVYADAKYARLLPGAKALQIGDFGVVVKGSRGESVDNTLLSKMARLWGDVAPDVARTLFGD